MGILGVPNNYNYIGRFLMKMKNRMIMASRKLGLFSAVAAPFILVSLTGCYTAKIGLKETYSPNGEPSKALIRSARSIKLATSLQLPRGKYDISQVSDLAARVKVHKGTVMSVRITAGADAFAGDQILIKKVFGEIQFSKPIFISRKDGIGAYVHKVEAKDGQVGANLDIFQSLIGMLIEAGGSKKGNDAPSLASLLSTLEIEEFGVALGNAKGIALGNDFKLDFSNAEMSIGHLSARESYRLVKAKYHKLNWSRVQTMGVSHEAKGEFALKSAHISLSGTDGNSLTFDQGDVSVTYELRGSSLEAARFNFGLKQADFGNLFWEKSGPASAPHAKSVLSMGMASINNGVFKGRIERGHPLIELGTFSASTGGEIRAQNAHASLRGSMEPIELTGTISPQSIHVASQLPLIIKSLELSAEDYSGKWSFSLPRLELGAFSFSTQNDVHFGRLEEGTLEVASAAFRSPASSINIVNLTPATITTNLIEFPLQSQDSSYVKFDFPKTTLKFSSPDSIVSVGEINMHGALNRTEGWGGALKLEAHDGRFSSLTSDSSPKLRFLIKAAELSMVPQQKPQLNLEGFQVRLKWDDLRQTILSSRTDSPVDLKFKLPHQPSPFFFLQNIRIRPRESYTRLEDIRFTPSGDKRLALYARLTMGIPVTYDDLIGYEAPSWRYPLGKPKWREHRIKLQGQGVLVSPNIDFKISSAGNLRNVKINISNGDFPALTFITPLLPVGGNELIKPQLAAQGAIIATVGSLAGTVMVNFMKEEQSPLNSLKGWLADLHVTRIAFDEWMGDELGLVVDAAGEIK